MNINLDGLVGELNQVLAKYGLTVQYAGITQPPPNPHSDTLPNDSDPIQDTLPNTHPEAGNRVGEPAPQTDLQRKQNNLRWLLGNR